MKSGLMLGVNPNAERQTNAKCMVKCISLTELIKVWDILHIKNTGDFGFTDLINAFEKVSGVENDISK